MKTQDLFKKPSGDLLGLPIDENHYCVEWDKHRVLFSFSQQGEALSCHFASDKDGLRHIKAAIDEFAHWVRDSMPWCKMLIAKVNRPSVGRLIQKCDFVHVVTTDKATAYMRAL